MAMPSFEAHSERWHTSHNAIVASCISCTDLSIELLAATLVTSGFAKYVYHSMTVLRPPEKYPMRILVFDPSLPGGIRKVTSKMLLQHNATNFIETF